jgi:(S)-ureidoglycine-glyoxylate aminotransferase
MGPGPINADPRVLRAMSAQLLGQFDPQFRQYMKEVSELYRGVFQSKNRWTLLIDGTARSAIEAALASLIEPDDRVLVPIFGRFGHLKVEIAQRYGAQVIPIEIEWGRVFAAEALEAALRKHQPKIVAVSHGDTSTTMAQPLDELGALCRAQDVLLYVDATATLGGMDLPVDAWQLVVRRRHTEAGLRRPDDKPGDGPVIRSNYFDLAMIMDYWSDKALNHHTEATSMLYAAHECARILLQEGLEKAFQRHARASQALTEGLKAMGLKLFGDQRHKMANVTGVHIPQGVDGDKVRSALLKDFNIEIGTSFGPLHGRIWRIGTMGYNARPDAVLQTLAALDAVLHHESFKLPRGAGVDAALAVYRKA